MTELPPPALTEIGAYESWRSEIQMWQITTTMEPKRQALAVRTKLCGKAREVALKLDAADLNNESGMSFLIDALDASFRKKPKKWDVPSSSSAKQNNTDNGQSIVKDDKQSDSSTNLSAKDKAKQRAAELNAKLTAEGKVLATATLPEQLNTGKLPSFTSTLHGQPGTSQLMLPEVKKLENGNSFAEFVINDVAARPFLTRLSTRDLIAQKSGTTVSLRGRFLSEEEKRRNTITNVVEKPLVLMIQANVAAKVQVALHKITEVCRIYETLGPENNSNNYGLTPSNEPTNHHFIQHKLWVGLDNIHPDFDLKPKLAGENGTNFLFMVQQTGAKVFLRGKGSGHIEPTSGNESFEALHIYISHPRQDGLDMAHQLCESLIETVKAQYEEWNAQRIAQPTPSYRPPCVEETELPSRTYPPASNGCNPPYGSIPSLMSKEVAVPRRHEEENRVPTNTSSRRPENSLRTTGVVDYREQTAVVDYRQMYSLTPISVIEPRPYASEPSVSVNEVRPPESDFNAGGMWSGKDNFEERYEQQSRDRTNDERRFEELDNRDRKSDRSSRRRPRSHENQNENDGKAPVRSPSPERKSRSRESKSKSKGSRLESLNHRESPPARKISPPPVRRTSPPPARRTSPPPARRTSPPPRRTSSPPARRASPPPARRTSPPPARRTSPPNRRDSSPPRRNSPTREELLSGRRDSPPRRGDSPPRRRDSGRRDLSPIHRDSPSGHRDSPPPGRQDSTHNRRDDTQTTQWDVKTVTVKQNSPAHRVGSPINRLASPPNRLNSPPCLRESPLARRDSPPLHSLDLHGDLVQKQPSPPKERIKRKFTEAAPKKKRKFSEDPRLIEQAKVQLLLGNEDKGENDIEQSITAYTSLESLNEKRPPPKLQFRSKKETVDNNQPKSILKPRSILKMAPPMNLPLVPKRNGVKSVKISPAGISKKGNFMENDVIFNPAPSVGIVKPPQAPPQKALKMGALGSLSMYDDDDSDDD